jgi:CRISPR/Cas system-associated exonuclease Cas4 (RecB family)
MQVTGTHIAYLHTCARKLWLFANGLNMEHTSEVVAEGRLIDVRPTAIARLNSWKSKSRE